LAVACRVISLGDCFFDLIFGFLHADVIFEGDTPFFQEYEYKKRKHFTLSKMLSYPFQY